MLKKIDAAAKIKEVRRKNAVANTMMATDRVEYRKEIGSQKIVWLTQKGSRRSCVLVWLRNKRKCLLFALARSTRCRGRRIL